MTTDKTLQFLSFSYLDKQEWGNFKYWELLLTGTHPGPGIIAVSRMPQGGNSLLWENFEDTIQLWIKNIFLLLNENMRINPEIATEFYRARCKEVLEQFKTATEGFNRHSGEKATDLISGIFTAEVEIFKNYALSQQLQDEQLSSIPVSGTTPTC